MNIDMLKHNRMKSSLHMCYASKGTAFWDTFLSIYKRVVSDEKYYILFVTISTMGCPLSKMVYSSAFGHSFFPQNFQFLPQILSNYSARYHQNSLR